MLKLRELQPKEDKDELIDCRSGGDRKPHFLRIR